MSNKPATDYQPVIEMRGVSAGAIRDLNSTIAEDVNWTVRAGDFWVIGGLQGAGKSDFLMMAGGLTPPSGGSYRFLGHDMPMFDEEQLPERLRLGFVFDGGQLFNHLTVGENVSLPIRYHHNLHKGEAHEEVQRMLDWTELAAWADSTPSAMSRNWQKRVGLARALMLRPEVLLLDNPLAGLDLRHRGWWLNVLEQLSRGHEWLSGRPMTLVITASDLRQWRGRAKQFAVLREKRFTILGEWGQVEAANVELIDELLGSIAHE